MRGALVAQPLVDDDGAFVLAWNGELFRSSLIDVPDGANDSAALFDAIQQCWFFDLTVFV